MLAISVSLNAQNKFELSFPALIKAEGESSKVIYPNDGGQFIAIFDVSKKDYLKVSLGEKTLQNFKVLWTYNFPLKKSNTDFGISHTQNGLTYGVFLLSPDQDSGYVFGVSTEKILLDKDGDIVDAEIISYYRFDLSDELMNHIEEKLKGMKSYESKESFNKKVSTMFKKLGF